MDINEYIRFETKKNGDRETFKRLQLDITSLIADYIETLDIEETEELLVDIGLIDSVTKIVIRRLTGESEVDHWSSNEWVEKVEVLSKMEDSLISDFKWNLLGKFNIDRYVPKMLSNSEIYWKMYHDEFHKSFFMGWLEANGIESRAKDTREVLDNIEDQINNLFKELANIKKEK